MNEMVAALLFKKLGGSGGGGYPEPTGTKQITANGTGIDVKDFAEADVNVPNTYQQGDEGKVVSNGSLVNQSSRNINSNGTIDTTLNNEVVVAVPNSYSAGDEGKVVENGALVAQTSRNITENGTVNTTKNNQVVVNVPPAGVKEYTASAKTKSVYKGWTTTFNAGNTLQIALPPTDGTTVELGDNVLVSGAISPASDSFKYYVTGEVTSFNGNNEPVITVKGLGNPSPVADGTYAINSNGTYNIKEYAGATVNVQGSGTTYINQNGTHDVGGYRYANVSVQSSAGNLLFATDATFQSTPVAESYGSATLDDWSVLMGHDEGDPLVLYGVDSVTGDNYLVYGRISLMDSWVEFYATNVGLISGGKGEGDIAILISAMFDTDPSSVQVTEVTPMSTSEIDALNIGDPVIIQGEDGNSSYVLTGTVDDNLGNTIMVLRRQLCYHDGSNIYIDKGGTFVGVPDVGISTTYNWADDSTIYNLYSGAKVMVTGEAGGVMWAAYGECTNVDTSTGEVMINPTISDDFSS